jgi:hypothetical protein
MLRQFNIIVLNSQILIGTLKIIKIIMSVQMIKICHAGHAYFRYLNKQKCINYKVKYKIPLSGVQIRERQNVYTHVVVVQMYNGAQSGGVKMQHRSS